VCDIVLKKFTFAISSPDEFLLVYITAIVSFLISVTITVIVN